MNSEPLSAFAETLRENDEQFYNTFPAAKLALYAPHTLYNDVSFVYYPIDGTYVQLDHPSSVHPLECPVDQDDQLHYDYPPVQSQQNYLPFEEPQTGPFVAATYDYNAQPGTAYATHVAEEPAGSVSPSAAQYASSPSSFYTSAETPPEVAVHDDPHTMPIQSPITAPNDSYVGPVRSHSTANQYPATNYETQSLARPPRPSRRHQHDNTPYPAASYPYQQTPPLPPRHTRSLSQGGMSAPQRMPVRALSASAASPVWIDAGVGSVGKGASHHGGGNVEVMTESPLSRPSIHSMRLSPLPSSKRPLEKKPPLACLFCRGRKIACGPPLPGSLDKTCNQCQRRQLECEYPAESRRGMRKKKVDDNLSTKEAPAPSVPAPCGKTLM